MNDAEGHRLHRENCRLIVVVFSAITAFAIVKALIRPSGSAAKDEKPCDQITVPAENQDRGPFLLPHCFTPEAQRAGLYKLSPAGQAVRFPSTGTSHGPDAIGCPPWRPVPLKPEGN